ncbi:MAG: DUF3488 and transglutaminase-like domain-containing protein [Lachnospiraceae bacterium]|nr:DUF3488 and transglutaminase-like domain-containing protein [Lachnospiraceae bacterium]MCM1239895.1 DUF3488 and transglutaminase-like domain-containing protein [Lachnospiraceae bacterium]
MIEWLRSHSHGSHGLQEKAAYRAVNACLLVCMALSGTGRFPGIGEPGAVHFAAAFVVLGVLTAVNGMTVRGKALCLTALFLMLGVLAGFTGGMDFWRSFLPWLAGQGAATQGWEMWYGMLQTGLLAVGCYLAQILFEKIPALKAGTAVLLAGVLIVCLLSRWEVSRPGMAFMLCFLVLTGVEWIQKHWEKKRIRENGFQAHMVWVFPFFALYLVLLLLMPAPEEPYDWMWVKRAYRQLQESIHTWTQDIKWGNREGFGMSFTGFSQEGALGGDVQENTREIMRVQVQPPSVGYLYLTGMVYDTFDGREWSRTRQGGADGVFLDTAQALYAVRDYNDNYRNDYLKEVKVNIRYEDFRTGYVFAPLKVWGLEVGSSNGTFHKTGQEKILEDACGDGMLCWNGQKGYGTEYELRYFRMNAGQQFDLFLEEAGKTGNVDEAVWKEVMKECERRNGQTFTLQDRADYREEIYGLYLGDGDFIKENLSVGLEKYLEEIMAGAETDVEKLRALETALSAYTYTLTPGELPESVRDAGDFLDYFLLESRQGYCTYFATAFVLLARAEGIPARYVQGYCVPVGEQGEASVSSNMAHAWPEAYVEGVGWIPFEPTPGYGSRRYESWAMRQAVTETEADPAEKMDFGAAQETEYEEENTAAAEEAEEPEEAELEGENASGYFWRLFGIACLLVLAVCGILLAIDNALGKYRYGKIEPEKRLRAEMFRNLTVLSCFGLKREEWETLEEFRNRTLLLLEWRDSEKEPPLRFVENYEKAVYGGEAVGEIMIRDAVDERDRFLERLKQERRWAWFYCQVRLYLERYRF